MLYMILAGFKSLALTKYCFIAWLMILSVIGQKLPSALLLPKTIGKALTVATSCFFDT